MSTNRLSTRFGAVLNQAIRTFPWLSRVRIGFCKGCNKDHGREWRLFAHSCHVRNVVCWARAAETELTDAEIDGVAAHELGHIVASEMNLPEHKRVRFRGQVTQAVEDEANETAAKMGMPVIYNARKLEEITFP